MTIDAGQYSVVVENGALARIGSFCASVCEPCRALLVSDSNVHTLYSDAVISSLTDAGFSVSEFYFPAGEENKTINTLSEILSAAADAELTRSDVMIALGGGVVGDMTGFAAAVYMRGVRFINVPTSLLAMVDASVGGKTGVDLPTGKNLAGVFYEPSLVISDPDVLSTLPEEELDGAMAEVIKTAMIGCEPLIPLVYADEPDYAAIVTEAVKFKAGVVSRDFRDNGERQLLNFGHTVGHAVEKASKYTISHGRAVATGMYFITKAAVMRGICDIEVLDRLEDLLRSYGLSPEEHAFFSPDELFEIIKHDKKKRGEKYTVVMPTSFGHAELFEFDEDEMREIMHSRYGKKMLLYKPRRKLGINANPSKSHAHRLLVLAALGENESKIGCLSVCEDVEKTVGCLRALGADIKYEKREFTVQPIDKTNLPSHAVLDCGESGTTFRFMLALTAALGIEAELKLSGTLPTRPIKPLYDVLEAHGAKIGGIGTDTVTVSGKLTEGEYTIDGGVSSQFTSALLLTLPLLSDSSVKVTGESVSKPYVGMTLDALDEFGYTAENDGAYRISARNESKEEHHVEGDWSSAAMHLVVCSAIDMGGVLNVKEDSRQGDKKIIEILPQFGVAISISKFDYVSVGAPDVLTPATVDCEDTPDLVPAVFVLGMYANGDTIISGCSRLRDKESDRIEALIDLAAELGVKAEYSDGSLVIHGHGDILPEKKHCYINTRGDHRIAMAAAAVSALTHINMVLDDWECVKKSYPDFWDSVFIGY